MKNTSRIHRNNNANISEKQGKKPTPKSPDAATKTFYMADGALRVGEAICLEENAIKLLASEAKSSGLTPAGYCKLAVLEKLFPRHGLHSVEGQNDLFDELSRVEILHLEAIAVFELLASRIERESEKHDPVASGIDILVGLLRTKILESSKSMMAAYNVAFPLKA